MSKDKLTELLENQAFIRENGGRESLSPEARDVFDAVDILCNSLVESRKDIEKMRADSIRVRAVRNYLKATGHFRAKLPDCTCSLCIIGAAVDYEETGNVKKTD